jgi:hypothetical protein
MTIRELQPNEWSDFFDAFSRHYRGQPVTIQVCGSSDTGPDRIIARRLALAGITAERDSASVVSLEVMVGDSPDEHLMHVIRDPYRVRVAQVSDGTDELLIINSTSSPTTYIDFSPVGLEAFTGLSELSKAPEVH